MEERLAASERSKTLVSSRVDFGSLQAALAAQPARLASLLSSNSPLQAVSLEVGVVTPALSVS